MGVLEGTDHGIDDEVERVDCCRFLDATVRRVDHGLLLVAESAVGGGMDIA